MKKFISVFLSLAMVLTMFATTPLTASAETYKTIIDGIKYKIDTETGEAKVVSALSSITAANILSEVDGYSVTSIGYEAFYKCTSLTAVTIGGSVTSIGDEAFDNCTSLTEVTIGDSVTSIGYSAFSVCTSLTSINVSENNQNYCSENGILFNKDKTELIQYPAGKTDTTYTIPDSVTSIGHWAFEDCTSLTAVTIPDSVTSIGIRAFDGCTSLTAVTIGDSVTSIGNYAFLGCTSLTAVTIPDSVTSIGIGVFWGCTSLTAVTIGDSVTSIGREAFSSCTSLTEVTIPDSVTSIGYCAFGYYNDGYKQVDNFTIYGYTGSKAETYANNNGFIFILLGQSQPTTQTPKGDANGDGKVSVADARKLVVAIAKGDTQALLEFGDVNGDGKVSVADVRKIVIAIAKGQFDF